MSGHIHPPPATRVESENPEMRRLEAIFDLRDQAVEVAAAAELYEPELDIAGDWRALQRDLERVMVICARDAARAS